MRDYFIAVAIAAVSVIAATACGQSNASNSGAACSGDDACTCSNGATGAQTCRDDGSFAGCACRPGPEECLARSDEYCDGLDNDCNGIIDDGEVCPDLGVANTMPFSGRIYFTSAAGSGTWALQRFWPTLDPAFLSGAGSDALTFRFRRSDGALYYSTVFSGLHQYSAIADTVIATPPCGTDVGLYIDFDASNTLYYQCSRTIVKPDGVTVADHVAELVAVLDDGRLIATRASADGKSEDYVVLDGNGNELSRLSPTSVFAGTMRPVPAAATVSANRGYVAYLRHYAIEQNEVVVFRVDETSTWARVRRTSVTGPGSAQLALSDGTVLIRDQDPTNHGETDRIVAYLPDGSTRVAWRETDAGSLRGGGLSSQLVAAPP